MMTWGGQGTFKMVLSSGSQIFNEVNKSMWKITLFSLQHTMVSLSCFPSSNYLHLPEWKNSTSRHRIPSVPAATFSTCSCKAFQLLSTRWLLIQAARLSNEIMALRGWSRSIGVYAPRMHKQWRRAEHSCSWLMLISFEMWLCETQMRHAPIGALEPHYLKNKCRLLYAV